MQKKKTQIVLILQNVIFVYKNKSNGKIISIPVEVKK